MEQISYEAWLEKVNELCMNYLGMGIHDGADFNAGDLWESYASPQEGFEAWLEEQDGMDPDLLEDILREEMYEDGDEE